jgi:hypothetical protein
LEKFLPAVSAAVRLPYYSFIEQDAGAPVFPTGILSWRGAGNYDDPCSAVPIR